MPKQRHLPTLLISVAVSLVSLLLLFRAQYLEAPFLKLEAKWLIVAGVPILLGLIVGGYVKTFKGFGIEMEALLQLSVGKIELIASDVVEVLEGDEKRSYSYLRTLPPERRRKIKRLSFTSGRSDYYRTEAVYRYLNDLRNLHYIDIKDKSDRFQALLDLKYFKSEGNIHQDRIEEFITALEENNFDSLARNYLITEYVSEKEPLLEVLKKLRKLHTRKLPVVTENRVFMGIITESLIEKKIADEVLNWQSKSA